MPNLDSILHPVFSVPEFTPPQLLVIEDSDEDYIAFCRILSQLSFNYTVHRCLDGDECLDFLSDMLNASPVGQVLRPKLVLLDLNLPGTDGREVLEQIRQTEHLRSLPVVIFTTSSNPKDIASCYQKGANGYVIKQMDMQKLTESIEVMLKYWLEINTVPLEF